MTYGINPVYSAMNTYGAQSYRPANYGSYQARPTYGAQPAYRANPVAAMWGASTRYVSSLASKAYSAYNNVAEKYPYRTGIASAAMGMGVAAMASCPYAGMSAAAPGLLNAAKHMVKGHPG